MEFMVGCVFGGDGCFLVWVLRFVGFIILGCWVFGLLVCVCVCFWRILFWVLIGFVGGGGIYGDVIEFGWSVV